MRYLNSTLNDVYPLGVINNEQLNVCWKSFNSLWISGSIFNELKITNFTLESNLNECLFENFLWFSIWHYINDPWQKDLPADPDYDVILFTLHNHFPNDLHIHNNADGRFLILEGEWKILLDLWKSVDISPWSFFDIPKWIPHEFYASKLTVLWINHRPIYRKFWPPDFEIYKNN